MAEVICTERNEIIESPLVFFVSVTAPHHSEVESSHRRFVK